jgi:hypothetical protein
MNFEEGEGLKLIGASMKRGKSWQEANRLK